MFQCRVIITILTLIKPQILCYTFNTEEVTVISPDNVKNRYFGYSVLLQRGNPSIVTVGAPRNLSPKQGGEVFQCPIDGTNQCKSAFKNDVLLVSTPKGDFLGASVEGSELADGIVIACSPLYPGPGRTITAFGQCLFRNKSFDLQEHSTEIELRKLVHTTPIIAIESRKYVNFAHSFFGFDLAIYNQDDIFVGVPGAQILAGLTVTFSLSNYHNVTLMPRLKIPNLKKMGHYFGYSVYAAKNIQNNEDWFLAGAPVANNFHGKVTLFKYKPSKTATDNQMDIIHNFDGVEFGSYFGASVLAVDLNRDKILDILIGAPMTGGDSFDEGRVYCYKSSTNSYVLLQTLVGSRQSGARFGTTITSLGDFDLDGFFDIAISAPYEDNGQGAVYIYRGNNEGIENKFSQRITGSNFNPPKVTRGLGFSLSRGNDINYDGHNDLAIGAYKSDQVFIIKSQGIIEFKAKLYSNILAIEEHTSNITYNLCLNYFKRSELLNLFSVDFKVIVNFDYRSEVSQVENSITVQLGMEQCEQYNVTVGLIKQDIYPFTTDAQVKPSLGSNTKALGNDRIQSSIPYAIGCSSNNKCVTGLTLEARTISKLVWGRDREINLHILISNDGDPAYQCEILINTTHLIKLRNNCQQTGSNYICHFSNKLDKYSSRDEVYVFEVQYVDLDLRQIEINVSVRSYGENKNLYKDRTSVTIELMANSTLYISGSSDPAILQLSKMKERNGTEVQITHRFIVSKSGPSPLRFNITLLLPILNHKGEPLVRVEQILGSIGNNPLKCFQAENLVTITGNEIANNLFLNQISLDGLLIYCDSLTNCQQYSCEGFLEISNQNAFFNIQLIMNLQLIVKSYGYKLFKKSNMVYLPLAVLHHTARPDRILSSANLFIYVPVTKYTPLWIFIVGAVIGLILLFLMITILHKCSFFKRSYQHKIQEQLVKDAIEDATYPLALQLERAEENDYVEVVPKWMS